MGSLYKLGGPYMGASVPIQVKEVSVWVLGSFYWCRGTPEWVQGSLYNIGGPCTGAEGVPGGEAVWPERESLCRCRGTLYSCRSCPYTHGGGLLYGFRGSLHRFGGGVLVQFWGSPRSLGSLYGLEEGSLWGLGVPGWFRGVALQFGVPIWSGFGWVGVRFGGPCTAGGSPSVGRGPYTVLGVPVQLGCPSAVWGGSLHGWESLYLFGGALCGSGSPYGLGVPVSIWGAPVWFGVLYSLGVPYSFGVSLGVSGSVSPVPPRTPLLGSPPRLQGSL